MLFLFLKIVLKRLITNDFLFCSVDIKRAYCIFNFVNFKVYNNLFNNYPYYNKSR